MQSYPTRERASEDRQGIASEWHPNRQHQQQPQRRAPPQNTSSSNQTSVPQGRLSPDVRRNYYTSPRQQQREYQQQQAGNSAVTSSHSLRARLPQHQIQIPPSEPIYLDIDPSIHQPMTVDHAGHPTPFTPTTNAAMMSPDIKSSHYVGQPPTHPANYRSSHPDGGIATTPQQQQQSRTHNSPNYPYVNPYVSPVAKEYRVQGGMFQNNYSPQPSYNNNRSANAASPTTSRDDNAILYDTTPIAANANSNNPAAQEYMIMFGDDYDLGSINTGMSQQELLQKRRDVKKRRDGKYGKKKKSKDRIIDIPPRLLASARSWDTSPITKLVGASNTKNANGNDKVDQHHPAKDIGSKSPKKQGQWNILRASTPTEDELGSTDASTRESAERSALNPAAPEHDDSNYNGRAPTPSDNHSIGSSSFPLLSSTARQGFVEQTRDAPAQYSHPGGYYSAPHHLQMQQQQQQGQMPPLYHYQQHRHLDNYERQHGEDLRQLEDQLRYLQEQHQQLEQEIQERQRLQQDPDGEDVRPRAVRFATQLAQDMEEQGPSDEESNTKDSPTSVAQFNAQDQDKAETSAIAPKALFGRDPGKPKSILRKRNNMDLDANGRYNSNYRGRIAAVTPRFYDTNGREVSPIRSPSRRPNEQQTLYQMDPPPTSDDANSIPENPDDKDIAVLFDSEADIDIELMQREFDEDSGVISDAFIEAVAAIVLQTAVRRFLGIQQAKRLRSERNQQVAPTSVRRSLSPSPTQTEGSLSQRAVASQGNRSEQQESQGQSRTTSMQTVASENQSDGMSMGQEGFFYHLAAIQIQSVFRGWWVRDSMNVDHYCATLIQKHFRGFKARMEYEYDLYRITLVQALWRRRIAKRRAISLLRNIVQIQAVCRGFQARKKIDRLGGFPSEADTSPRLKRVVSQESSEGSTRQHSRDRSRKQAFEKARLQRRRQLQQEKRRAKAAPERPPPSAEEAGIQQVASIIIQTYWRSYFGRACYLQYIADVTLMQSVVRRCLAKRQTAKVKRGASNKIGRAPRHPHRDVTSSYGANFKKIESFESRNVSSMVPEGSVGSCNKKTNSVDDSVPSVPFKMLAEDDTDQPPSLTPPRKAREKSTGRSPSHFENANRFGGVRKAPWNSSGASGQYAVTSSGSYENGIVESQSDVSSGGWYNRNGARKNSSDSYSVEKGKWDEKANQKPGDNQVSDQTSAVAKDIPRSKGWNVEEEIEKEATRNLIMAWKQKDKANTFTIKPRGGM